VEDLKTHIGNIYVNAQYTTAYFSFSCNITGPGFPGAKLLLKNQKKKSVFIFNQISLTDSIVN